VRNLRRSPPVESNELFDIATNFSSGEEAVGAIFDGKKDKRVDDAPAEGSKSKEPSRSTSRARSPTVMCTHRGATTTRKRPSQSTRPARALKRSLDYPVCSTTC
jgi:hypothetical protein